MPWQKKKCGRRYDPNKYLTEEEIRAKELFLACSRGRIKAIRALVREQGASLDGARDSMGRTVLHVACANPIRAKVARALCRLGADASATDLAGNTPMHVAAGAACMDTLEVLRGAGASMHGGGPSNTAKMSPFMEGVRKGHVAVVTWFMRALDALPEEARRVAVLKEEEGTPAQDALRKLEAEAARLQAELGAAQAAPRVVLDFEFGARRARARSGGPPPARVAPVHGAPHRAVPRAHARTHAPTHPRTYAPTHPRTHPRTHACRLGSRSASAVDSARDS